MSNYFYLPLVVNAGEHDHHNRLVEVELNFKQTTRMMTVNKNSLHLIEVTQRNHDLLLDKAVPFQFDPDSEKPDGMIEKGTLIFLLNNNTSARTTRCYHLCFSTGQEDVSKISIPSQISFENNIMYRGQESLQIITPQITYYYHKQGAGFAGLIDQDGNDWIGFHPYGGSDGRYRGIPNLVYPEGHFHPGDASSTTRILSQGPLKLTIHSETHDKQWACSWEIYSNHAQLSVLKANHPYWFLYEGTPGGELNLENDFVVRSTGHRTTAGESWDEILPAPTWVYFGASNSDQVLFILQHETNDHKDSYWAMEGNMTVFGFGRYETQGYLDLVPAHFTIGLATEDGTPSVVTTIESLLKEPIVQIGDPQPMAIRT